MKSKLYNWEEVSLQIKYIATDRNGRAYGYLDKPRPFKSYGKWTNAKFLPEEEGGLILDKKDNPFQGEWLNSLESRPKHKK